MKQALNLVNNYKYIIYAYIPRPEKEPSEPGRNTPLRQREARLMPVPISKRGKTSLSQQTIKNMFFPSNVRKISSRLYTVKPVFIISESYKTIICLHFMLN